MSFVLMLGLISSCAHAQSENNYHYIPSIEIEGVTYTINDMEDIQEQIDKCVTIEYHAHQLAEHARALGYEDGGMVISSAKTEYREASNKKSELIKIYDSIKSLVNEYTEEDLYYLAKIIYGESGADYCSDLLQLTVGTVVLNRTQYTNDCPSTIKGVVMQQGQYSPTFNKKYWDSLIPDERAYRNAERLLKGERFAPPDVFWQAEFKQGKIFWKDVHPNYTMYFCYY